MKIRKLSRNFPRSRKFIPAKFLNGPIREILYSRKLILALGDRESLSRKFIPAKVYTNKVFGYTFWKKCELTPRYIFQKGLSTERVWWLDNKLS